MSNEKVSLDFNDGLNDDGEEEWDDGPTFDSYEDLVNGFKNPLDGYVARVGTVNYATHCYNGGEWHVINVF